MRNMFYKKAEKDREKHISLEEYGRVEGRENIKLHHQNRWLFLYLPIRESQMHELCFV